jgi:hypothetical protein
MRRTGTLAILALAALAGCTTRTDVSVTGSAPALASRLAVTVKEIWFAEAADTQPDAASGWLKQPLTTPITVDLARQLPGTLGLLASGLNIPAGHYQQVHLVLADSTASLNPSAQSTGLLYNSQISTVDVNGNISDLGLEQPVPGAGLTLATDFFIAATIPVSQPTVATTVSAATPVAATTNAALALVIDASRDVLSYTYGSSTGYILSPTASLADENRAGGISGTIDASALPPGHAPVYVSAEVPDATATHHVVIARRLIGADGSFTLYPLPAVKSGSTPYDIVVSCAGANTVVVRGVPVNIGAIGASTAMQAGAIALTPAPTVYADIASQPPLLPGGTRVAFYQTVEQGAALPYQIDSTAVDLLSRHLPGDSFALSAGALEVGDYANGGTVALTPTQSAAAASGYIVGTEARYRVDTLANAPALVGGSLAAPTLLTAPMPQLAIDEVNGQLNIAIAVIAGRFDTGFVTIMSGSQLIDTADVSATLAAGSGNVAVTVPAGGASAGSGINYQVALRAWNSADPAGTLQAIAAPASVQLADSAAATISIQTPST